MNGYIRNGIYYATINGKRRSLKTKDLKVARKRLSQYMCGGSINDPEVKVPLNLLFQGYLDLKQASNISMGRYWAISRCLERFTANLGISFVDGINLHKLHKYLLSKYRVSPNSCKKDLQILKSAFDYGVMTGFITSNPIKSLILPSHTQKKKVPLNYEELKILYKTIKETTTCGDIVLFLIKTCTRFGTASGLKWKDVDLDKGKFRVTQENNKTKDKGVVTIPLDQECLNMLLNRPRINDNVFSDTNGQPIKHNELYCHIRRIGTRILNRDDNIGVHHIRCSSATYLYEKGVDIRVIQRILGHTTITTTERYLGVQDHRISEVVDLLPSMG